MSAESVTSMSELPEVPDFDADVTVQVAPALVGISNVSSLGEAANAPPDKNEDELAQLPCALAEQLPDAAAYQHPALIPNAKGAEPSNEDFPFPAIAARRKIDKKLLDPYDSMERENVWPGRDGLPFRGKSVPSIKDDDELQPSRATKAHVDVFNLADQEDLIAYEKVMQVIANGFGALGAEERVYDNDVKNWRIFVRWWELYFHMPKK